MGCFRGPLLFWGMAFYLLMPALAQDGGYISLEFSPGSVAQKLLHREPVVTNLDEVRKRIGYPVTALVSGVEGTVAFQVLVNEQGEPIDHTLVHSLSPEIDQRVASYIGELRFLPARNNDTLVEEWVDVAIEFDQEDGIEMVHAQVDDINFLGHPSGNSIKAAEEALASGADNLESGALEAARWDLQKAVRMTPGRKNPTGRSLHELFHAHHLLAQVEMALGNYESAAIHWTETIWLANSPHMPKDSRVHEILGTAYLGRSRANLYQGRVIPAYLDCQWVLRNFDETAVREQAYLEQGQVNVMMGRYGEALENFQMALNLNPQCASGYLHQAEIPQSLGSHEVAHDSLNFVQVDLLSAEEKVLYQEVMTGLSQGKADR